MLGQDSDKIPAATLVVFRQSIGDAAPQVLMVERASTMRFAAGAAVFPGGRVDAADVTLAENLGDPSPQCIGRIAAIRETWEETGLALGFNRSLSAKEAAEGRHLLLQHKALAPVLKALDLRLDLDTLPAFAHWRQPTVGGFDTLFFLANLGSGRVDLAVDATENTNLFWATPAQVLARADAGDLRIIFPTRRNLERLAQFASYAQAVENAARHPIRPISGQPCEKNGEAWLMIPDGLGYPVLGERLATARRG
ncbi:NUDIX hydrolase [Novosphingobium umbonatum]|uniref:NUDIX hydrolase n=1 Tax=Novosphingobium umbonatum TaxID=1908524 RepID=A0A3S2V4V8_9SPHN|nr:NUDIX domain-containing protein [Novosphingobium umbonatum]RVU03531.1 NUDIX hydrolase [Novosphingobium umbonatum]